MAKQNTDTKAVLNLVINGEAALTTLKELTDTQRKLNSELRNMKPGDPGYKEKLDDLKALNAAIVAQRREMNGVNKETEKFKTNWKDIAAGVIGANVFERIAGGALNAAIKIKEAYGESQKFRAVLTNAFKGDGVMANNALTMLQDFAADTPEQLNSLTDSYIKLVGRGIGPTVQQLTNIGDVASSVGKPFADLNEAILDVNNTERWTELGIKVKTEGDRMTGTFKGVSVEVERTERGALKMIETFGEMDGVKGTMASVSATVVGLGSNIEDSWDQIYTKLGQRSEGFIYGFMKTYADTLSFVNERLLGTKTASDDLSRQWVDQSRKVQSLENNLNPLINKYEELTKKGKLNKDEQAQLRSVIDQVSKVVPQAVTAFDKYGNALGINTEKARNFLKMQRALVQYQNRDALAETREQIAKVEMLRNAESRLLDNMVKKGIASGKEISAIQQKVESRNNLLFDTLYPRLKALKGGLIDDVEKTLQTDAPVVDAIVPNGETDAQKKAREKAEKEAEQAAKKALAEFGRLNEAYRKLGLDRLQETLSANEKEIAAEEQKYNELILKEQAFLSMKGITATQRKAITNQISELETQKGEAVKNIRVRQEEEMLSKIERLRESLTEVYQTELQKERDQINAFYDALESDNAGNDTVLANLRLQRQQDLSRAELREKERLEKTKRGIEDRYASSLSKDDHQRRLKELNEAYDAEITAIKSKFSAETQETAMFNDTIAALNKERNEKIEEENKNHSRAIRNAAIDVALEVSDSIFQIMSNNRQAESEQKISMLEKERERELSNKNLTESQKKEINDKYDKKIKAEKLKAWHADQRAALAQAVIQGALSVVKALPNIALSIAAGVAAAAQIAVIASQKPPQYAKGGFIPNGPSHAQGGIKMIDSKTGSVVGELEGGEPILSKDTYRNNRQTIDDLLYSSQRKNGANIGIDVGRMQVAERYYRTGGLTPTSSNSISQPSTVNVVTDFTDVKSMIADLAISIDRVDKKQVILSHAYLEEEQQKRVAIRNDSSA